MNALKCVTLTATCCLLCNGLNGINCLGVVTHKAETEIVVTQEQRL